jgi:TldD protein
LTNTYLAQGSGTPSDLIRVVDLGVYLGEPVSVTDDGMVTLRAGLGRMIRKGELAEPVKGASLSGDPLGLFGMIDAVGADFTWDTAAATCSLGGQTVPVGSGAPHIRLVEALVGDQS